MLGEELLRYDRKQEYVFFDCETCNLNLASPKNVPWQWGWVRANLNGVIEERSVFVKWPEINVSKDAARITGFYLPRVLEEGIEPEEALDELEKVIYDPNVILVAHNALNFDVYLHQIHRTNLGRPVDYSYFNRLIDSIAIAKAIKHKLTPPKNPLDFLAFQYKMSGYWVKEVKTSIKALCSEYEVPYEEGRAHDAVYDCHLLYQLWKKMICQIEL